MAGQTGFVGNVLPYNQARGKSSETPLGLVRQSNVGMFRVERFVEFGENSIDDVLVRIDVSATHSIVHPEAHQAQIGRTEDRVQAPGRASRQIGACRFPAGNTRRSRRRSGAPHRFPRETVEGQIGSSALPVSSSGRVVAGGLVNEPNYAKADHRYPDSRVDHGHQANTS